MRTKFLRQECGLAVWCAGKEKIQSVSLSSQATDSMIEHQHDKHALTRHAVLQPAYDRLKNARSRGALPVDFLNGSLLPMEYLNTLKPEVNHIGARHWPENASIGQKMHLLSLRIVSMSFQAWHFHVAAYQGATKVHVVHILNQNALMRYKSQSRHSMMDGCRNTTASICVWWISPLGRWHT